MMKLLVSLGLALAVSLVASGACAVSSHRALPAETLSGTRLSVPDDLPKKPVLFVVGFSKASKTQTSAWSRALEKRISPGRAVVYGVSVIEDVPGLFRGFVARSIRHGVPEVLHDRFLLVSKQSDAWKAMAAWKVPDDAYVILMNAARQVVWRVSGPVTEKKLVALTNELRSYVAEAAPGKPVPAG